MRPSALHWLYADQTRSCRGVFLTVEVQAPRRRVPERAAIARSTFIACCLPEDCRQRLLTGPKIQSGTKGPWLTKVRVIEPRRAVASLLACKTRRGGAAGLTRHSGIFERRHEPVRFRAGHSNQGVGDPECARLTLPIQSLAPSMNR